MQPAPDQSHPSAASGQRAFQRSLLSLILVPLLGWCLFLLVFMAFYPVVGKPIAILNFLLLAGLAWFGGMKYGLLQAVIGTVVLTWTVNTISNTTEVPAVTAIIVGSSLALTALVGYLRDTRMQLLMTQQGLMQTQDALQFQAEHDSLTGLHNRRFFGHRLDAEHARAQRYDLPLSVVLLDIDRFKQVNDLYSHAVGDRVLQEVGKLLQNGIREVDTVARYGGEEFALCLPSTSVDGAMTLCERLRLSIETHDWEAIYPGLRVTISGGIFSGPPLGPPERMLSVADHRLYMAKESGRNRIQTTDANGLLN
ncbi:GGDEF domain-containing protein [Deinococcus radiomollis]|uniref:GGDEF domain-containing protein n=1 Tax=Deinococcus radiomollis TaxID=468916 RepID=UPI003891A76D